MEGSRIAYSGLRTAVSTTCALLGMEEILSRERCAALICSVFHFDLDAAQS